LHELRKRSKPKQRKFSKAMRQIHGDTAVAELASTDAIARARSDVHDFLAGETAQAGQEPKNSGFLRTSRETNCCCARRAIRLRPVRPATTSKPFWTRTASFVERMRRSGNWLSLKSRCSLAQDADFESRLDDGTLVLGGVELKADALVLSVNSKDVAPRMHAAVRDTRELVRQPSLKTENRRQMIASARTEALPQLDIPEEERCAIVHDQLDRHYREVLDQPVPMLGGTSPRAAVRTASGRIKVAGWLKMMENALRRPLSTTARWQL